MWLWGGTVYVLLVALTFGFCILEKHYDGMFQEPEKCLYLLIPNIGQFSYENNLREEQSLKDL